MAKNREISQFAGLVTVNDSSNQVTIGSTLLIGGSLGAGAGTTTNVGGDLKLTAGNVNVVGIVTANNVQTTNINGGQIGGFKNYIINGWFDVWQRGTSLSTTATGLSYTADRFAVDHTGASYTSTETRVSNPFSAAPCTYAMELTTPNTGNHRFRTNIELPGTGNPGQFVVGSQWTLSWYSDYASWSPSLQFADFGYGGNATTSWTAGPLVSLGGDRYSKTYTVTTAPNGTNVCVFLDSTIVSPMKITGIQLEAGPIATPLEHRPISLEREMCQRYYMRRSFIYRETPVQRGYRSSSASGVTIWTMPYMQFKNMRKLPSVATDAALVIASSPNTNSTSTYTFSGITPYARVSGDQGYVRISCGFSPTSGTYGEQPAYINNGPSWIELDSEI